MTPKEKAEELFKKLYQPIFDIDLGINVSKDKKRYESAKQCALIAVEFAREQFRNYCCAEIGTDGSPDDHFDAIKQKIEKL